MLAVLLIGPTTLEFWTKTAILASLVIACGLRFALIAFLEPFDTEGTRDWMFQRFRWQVPAALAVALVCIGILPVAADLSTRSPQPFAELPDGTFPKVTLAVGSGPAIAVWTVGNASAALPPRGNAGPVSASARAWFLPPIPPVSLASNVSSFDSSITQKVANKMAHDAVLDLIIESEARRAHDLTLAKMGASDDGLKEFVDVIKQDITAKKIIQKTYSFDTVSVNLFLPKFATQASRLVGITLHGTSTLITRDALGNAVSQVSSAYSKSWGLWASDGSGNLLIQVDYTGLATAP
jgi:hypothetical protein